MAPSPLRFPIGLSDFRSLREGGFAYVDKTSFITDVIDQGAPVLLVPRPRRFGKTLNLSMLRCFFEAGAEDARPLFEGLSVLSNEGALRHFQRHPVVFLTFKDVKPASWRECLEGVAHAVSRAYGDHRHLLTSADLPREDARLFTALLERTASRSDLVVSLDLLSRVLCRHHRERVVILIDEYDSPIHAGYEHGYHDEVVAFFRDFLSGGLKDNPRLWKGVLTGILRVAKESLFSGLNNVEVFSILRADLATAFGFTEAEVRSLALSAGQGEHIDGLRAHYNGYLFGGRAIYNPWSVLSFLARGDGVMRPHWVETSSNDLLRDLLLRGPRGSRAELETLLSGGSIEKRVDDNIVFRDLAQRPDAVWGFLLFTGYLKAVSVSMVDGRQHATLALPNAEVAVALADMVQSWFEAQAGGPDELQSMLDALLRGDAPVVEKRLSHVLKVNLSFFDAAAPEPERFYHGLVLGLLAGLSPRHDVRSNREFGAGRCDVLVSPKVAGGPGVVLELKRARTEAGETIERAFAAAFAQIRERDHSAELRERGARPIHEMVAVFVGKSVLVRSATAKDASSRTASPRSPAAKERPRKTSVSKKGVSKRGPSGGASLKKPSSTKKEPSSTKARGS